MSDKLADLRVLRDVMGIISWSCGGVGILPPETLDTDSIQVKRHIDTLNQAIGELESNVVDDPYESLDSGFRNYSAFSPPAPLVLNFPSYINGDESPFLDGISPSLNGNISPEVFLSSESHSLSGMDDNDFGSEWLDRMLQKQPGDIGSQ